MNKKLLQIAKSDARLDIIMDGGSERTGELCVYRTVPKRDLFEQGDGLR